jgi:hypothetical protein
MAEAAAAAQPGSPFIPHALVPISIGRSTVYVYLCVESTMQPHERAQAYHITLTVLTLKNMDL